MIKYFFFCFIIMFSFSNAQKNSNFNNFDSIKEFHIPDSLINLSFKELQKGYYNNLEFPLKAHIYIKSYLKKSIAISDTAKIVGGYYRISRISKDSLKLKYINQAIFYSKNNNHKFYTPFAYLEKGNILFDSANYKEALDNYFTANNIAIKINPKLSNKIKFNIGLLKSRIGEHNDALKIFKDYRIHIENEERTHTKSYLLSLFAIAYSQTRLKKMDSATSTNDNGIKHSIMQNDNTMHNYFIMNEGVNLFFKKKYAQSIDSLLKTMPFLAKENDHFNTISTRFYLGKSLLNLNMTEKALNEFEIADILLKKRSNYTLETREIYKILIDHYKKRNNKEKQLFYLNRLISCDSILTSNYRYINEKIIVDFDTPQILLEKENIINDLNKSNLIKTKGVILLIFFSLTICILLIFRMRKVKKGYETKFNELTNEMANESSSKNNDFNNHLYPSVLSDGVIHKIENGLNDFILKKEYLDKTVSINSIAKKMDSNSKYLSQYVNLYKKKKFTDFINDLRIEYSIEKLKNDKKFRRYTIKAISEAVGFSNPISFSQAFLKKTGIKPSYFIKKLENKG